MAYLLFSDVLKVALSTFSHFMTQFDYTNLEQILSKILSIAVKCIILAAVKFTFGTLRIKTNFRIWSETLRWLYRQRRW